MSGHLEVLVARIALSMLTASDGRLQRFQFLISTGSPRVLTREYFSEMGILFSMQSCCH